SRLDFSPHLRDIGLSSRRTDRTRGIHMSRRRLAAVVSVLALTAIAVVVLAQVSSTSSSKPTFKPLPRLAAVHEGGQQGNSEAAEAAAEAYSDRAFPADDISIDQIQGAIAANDSAQSRNVADPTNAWDYLGPNTLNVDRLATQAFNKATQWSGRVTAITIDPKCRPTQCRIYVAAAGGGVWRSTNSTAAPPLWVNVSSGIPTNAIGSIAVDPNDPTGKTVYVGTGEASGSAAGEPALGLCKWPDGGDHWSLVPGSAAVANNRSIAWVAIQPGNANHILIGTRSGTRGLSSNGPANTPPGAPPVGLYNSTDGGASFGAAPVVAGSINEVKFDPTDVNTIYATLAGSATGGLLRSQASGVVGSWTPIFQENRGRLSFAAVT